MKPRIYSYTRFSTPEQAKGDSERRQLEAAERFAAEKGLTLDTDLRMVDRGLSGYHGKHRAKGALGIFLEKVEAGQVAPGSILLVENADRLSREPVATAQQTVLNLLQHGIVIEMLFPRDTMTLEIYNKGGHWRMSAHIERAHAESDRKHDLATANWRQKRKLATEKILTGRAPAWLRVVDGKFEVIPQAAATVEQIFALKLDGLGKNSIEKRLNETAVWIPENGWHASYIEKILRTRAVIGEFQPHRLDGDGKRVPDGEPIPNYFPAVVDPKTFHAVQRLIASNRGTGGKTGKALNVFQGLVRCGYCGGPMVFIDKGDGCKYLVCDNGRRGITLANGSKCRAPGLPYQEFQDTLLDNLSQLRPEAVLPSTDEAAQQAKALRDAVAGLTGEIADAAQRIDNLVDQIANTANAAMRTRYEQRAAELEAKQKELEAQRAKQESSLHELERAGKSFEKWQKDLNGLKSAIAKDADTRIRLRTHLKEFIARVEVFPHGCEDDVEHAIELIHEHLPAMARAESFPQFKKYLRKRLLSAEGRCFRLFLRCARPNSAGLQIAPISSVAGSFSIQHGNPEWGVRGPKIDALAKEFFDHRKPGQFAPKSTVNV